MVARGPRGIKLLIMARHTQEVATPSSANQLGLFDQKSASRFNRAPIFAKRDPVTSKLAAESIERSGAVSRQSTEILNYMRAHPQAQTSAEIAQRGGFDRHNVGRRMSALTRQGHVKREGVRLCGACGRECVTWAVVAK